MVGFRILFEAENKNFFDSHLNINLRSVIDWVHV
jgi:hypothetical protein